MIEKEGPRYHRATRRLAWLRARPIGNRWPIRCTKCCSGSSWTDCGHRVRPLNIGALSRELNVSQTPLREALARLEHTGLVRREALKGYRVAPLFSETELIKLMDARLVLEPTLTYEAGRRTTPSSSRTSPTASRSCGAARPGTARRRYAPICRPTSASTS